MQGILRWNGRDTRTSDLELQSLVNQRHPLPPRILPFTEVPLLREGLFDFQKRRYGGYRCPWLESLAVHHSVPAKNYHLLQLTSISSPPVFCSPWGNGLPNEVGDWNTGHHFFCIKNGVGDWNPGYHFFCIKKQNFSKCYFEQIS